MVWSNDMRLYAIKVHVVGMSTPKYITGVRSTSVRGQSEVDREVVAGSIFAGGASLLSTRLVSSFATRQIKQAIDTIGLGGAGACIDSDGTHPGVDLYFAKQACNAPASGSVHVRYNIKKGIFVPRSLNCPHKGNAELSYDLYAIYDGVNDPVTKVGSQALPSGSADDGSRYFLTTGVVNTQTCEGKVDVSVDFQPSISQASADGLTYDTAVSIASILPIVRFQGVEPDWFGGIAPLAGATVDDLNTKWLLQRRNTPSITAVHCMFACSGLLVWDTVVEGGPSAPAQSQFSIHTTTSSAGNNPVTCDTAWAAP